MLLFILNGQKSNFIDKENINRLVVTAEKAMAPHSSTLAWKVPWMEEPGGLQSMGSQRVGHDLAIEQQQIYILNAFCFKK